MEESAKKSTRVSNLEKMSPEKRAKVMAFRASIGKLSVDALNQGVIEEGERRKRRGQAEKAGLEQKDQRDEKKS